MNMRKVVSILALVLAIYGGAVRANAFQDYADSTQQVAEKVKDIVIYHDERYYATFPSIVRKPDGEFLLSFRRAPDRRNFGSKGYSHTDPNSYLVQMTSRDGINWSGEPELLYDHDFGGSQDPCLLQLSDGTLLCTSYGWTQISEADRKNLRTPNFVTGGGFAFLGGYVVRSSDGGSTDIGYPWAVVLDEKHALVTYCFNKENQTRHIAGSIIRF